MQPWGTNHDDGRLHTGHRCREAAGLPKEALAMTAYSSRPKLKEASGTPPYYCTRHERDIAKMTVCTRSLWELEPLDVSFVAVGSWDRWRWPFKSLYAVVGVAQPF